MELTSDDPIRLDRLALACMSFVDLQYVRLAPDGSLFDAAGDEAREEAVINFLTYLEDDEEEDVAEVRRTLAWLLNLSPERFGDVVYRLRIPYPRFDPADIRRFLELLWTRAWGGDWQIPSFDPDVYKLVMR